MKRKRRNYLLLIAAGVVMVALVVSFLAVSRDQQSSAAPTSLSVVTVDGELIAVPVPGRPTAVYFFISNCGPCLPALRRLGPIANAHPEVAYVPVSISPYDNASSVSGFLRAANDPDRVAALDPLARLATGLHATALGTLIVFDRRGTPIYRGVDPDASTMTAIFDQATKQ